MNRMMKSLVYFCLFLLVLALTGGCGGSGGTVSITDNIGGGIITQPDATTQSLTTGNDNFNSGNYANAVFSFQQALLQATTDEAQDEAREGLGWAMARNGSPIGSMDTGSVILTFESISTTADDDLLDYNKQSLNDARVGLAFAYISRNQANDAQKARQLLERIDPINNAGTPPSFNQYFAYLPERNNGMTNGTVHALMAYSCYLVGDIDAAKTQIEFAYQREPYNEFIKEMRTNLTLLGLFN